MADTFIDENTPRAGLEVAAIFTCGFDTAKVQAATNAELLEMIRDWIEAGDETEK